MRSIKICIIVLLTAVFVNWVRNGDMFHISRILPFLDGPPVTKFDFAKLAILIIICWGIARLKKNARRKRQQSNRNYDEFQGYGNYYKDRRGRGRY